MSEAPKKIWWDEDYKTAVIGDFDRGEIPYIRADIVEELVAALKFAHCWTSKKIHEGSTVPIIEAALAKLEEE